jgi:glutathione synthase/RimK-type ligase-like ATP-grasp enzyme
MRRLALKAARILQFEFAGVDFITHKKTGQMYLLEVNRSPGFEGFMKATGRDVPLELMKFFLPFVRKNLKSQA